MIENLAIFLFLCIYIVIHQPMLFYKVERTLLLAYIPNIVKYFYY